MSSDSCLSRVKWNSPTHVEITGVFVHGFYARPCGCDEVIKIGLNEELRASREWGRITSTIMESGGRVAVGAELVGSMSTFNSQPDLLHIQEISAKSGICNGGGIVP